MSLQTFEAAPTAKSTRLISFDRAEVQRSGYGNEPVLIVSGQAPCANMQIALQPLIFIRCPEYWGIEVVGTLPGGICLTALKPYKVTIPLTGIIGSKGIEVIGSNKTEQIDLKGGCHAGATQPTE
jgi:hypothetical protein